MGKISKINKQINKIKFIDLFSRLKIRNNQMSPNAWLCKIPHVQYLRHILIFPLHVTPAGHHCLGTNVPPSVPGSLGSQTRKGSGREPHLFPAHSLVCSSVAFAVCVFHPRSGFSAWPLGYAGCFLLLSKLTPTQPVQASLLRVSRCGLASMDVALPLRVTAGYLDLTSWFVPRVGTKKKKTGYLKSELIPAVVAEFVFGGDCASFGGNLHLGVLPLGRKGESRTKRN